VATGFIIVRAPYASIGGIVGNGWLIEDLDVDVLIEGVGLLCQNPPGGPRTTTEAPLVMGINFWYGMS